ncbi:tripartite tricarboxylate transporter substrate-binding protein [Comamonas thiooxydans]|uniref:tripartite tricarboxylate transporter substrate-binding protein n=1 Tax=Comamonas thiooxydans TaxID=363952 RepID=UPI00070BE74C|nr:tripartite tricarboxylate transporter substrate-binding protein [Comamonas thiooxydans]
MPEVPTLAEHGIPMSTDSWYAIFVPAKTHEPVQRKLRSALAQATASADFKKTLSDLGLMPTSMSLADFDAVRRKDVATWAQLVKLSGAKAE